MFGELLKNKNEIKRWCKETRKRGFPIIFTNGCYDIFHAGHAEFLHDLSMRLASKNGQILVAINSDKSIRRLKALGRPINTQKNRASVVGACRAVSSVCIFDAVTPLRLIELVRPDVLAKASDYAGQEIVGSKFVKSYGGQVIFGPYKKEISTSSIIAAVRGDFLCRRAVTAYEAYSAVVRGTESLEVKHVGADLAYLMGAILEDGKMDIWKRNQYLVELLEREVWRDHPVWKHLNFKEKTT